MPRVVLQLVPGEFSVCRLPAGDPLPAWAESSVFSSVTRSAAELSVICPSRQVPTGIKSESGWSLLQFAGPFAFAAVGILASVTEPLARAGVSLLAVATFDTDFVLIKADRIEDARQVLEAAGHAVQL